MDFNFGKFEIVEGKDGWYVTRNGDSMAGVFSSKADAASSLRMHIIRQVDEKLAGGFRHG